MASDLNVIQEALGTGKLSYQAIYDSGMPVNAQESRQLHSGGQSSLGPAAAAVTTKYELPEDHSNAEMFFASALSSGTKELVGSRPSRLIEEWRSEHPIAGAMSWMVGSTPFFLAPQLGAVKAASGMLPGFTKALSLAEKLKGAGSAFRGGALLEGTKFAPLETGRVLGSLLNPEEGSTQRAAIHATSELGFLGVLGGIGAVASKNLKHLGFERLRQADPELLLAREKRVSDHIGEGFDRTGAPQDKWEVLKVWSKKPEFEQSAIRDDVEQLMGLYEKQIRIGEPPLITKKKTTVGPDKKPLVTETLITRYMANMGSSGRTKRIESLFEAGIPGGKLAKGILSKIMKIGSDETVGGFTGEGATKALANSTVGWEKIVSEAGLTDSWQAITQYPRQLIASSESSAKRLQEILTQDFYKIGNDAWYARESAEGLYVGVKRLTGKGRRGEGGEFVGDQYYIFKTNKPRQWFPEASGVHDTNARTFLEGIPKWNRVEYVPNEQVPTLATMEHIWGLHDPALAMLHGGVTRMSSNPNVSAEATRLRLFWDRVFPQSVVETAAPFFEATKVLGNRAKQFVAPARLQAKNNPRLQNIIMATTRFFEAQAARANNIILGPIADKFIRTSTKTPLRSIFGNAIKPDQRRVGGTQAMFKDLLNSEEALVDFNKLRMHGMNPEEALKANLHPNAVELAVQLDKVDDLLVKEIAAQAKALGMENTFMPRKGHYTIANTWVGNFRVALKDVNGEVVGFASGHSRSQAGEEAIRLTELINGKALEAGEPQKMLTFREWQGKSADVNLTDSITHAGSEEAFKKMIGLKALQKELGLEAWSVDTSARQADIFGFATQINMSNDLVQTLRAARASMYDEMPQRFLKSKHRIGARGTENVPFTVQELQTTHSAGVIESLRYLAREATAHGPMSDQLHKLAIENAGDAVTFNRIFNSLNGVGGPFARAIEKGVDGLLADVVGPGSATRMVRATNEAMFLLTLGAFDMGFAALNMITPLQTALPEVSFLLGAPPEIVQRYYSSTLVRTAKGVRPGSFLDTMRFARVAADDLLRPDQGTRNALARAFDEHVVGRDFVETVHGGMASIAKGEGGIYRNFQRWSEAPIVATEEASRSYSFLLGRRVAKDFYGLEEDAAFEFARQFVQTTMYGYGAADRPRVLTGALGAGWGLFKNWTMNYTGNLVKYSAEATRGHFNPLMWAGATTGAIGGLSAMPLAGMADGFAEWAGDKSINDFIYETLGNGPGDESKPVVADFLAHGFPSLLGFTLRSRASAPSAHLMTDITMFSNIAMLDRTIALGELMGTFVEDVSDFRVPLQDPKFRRELLRTFAPRTLQRAVTGFAQDGVQSLKTGNNLMPALNIREGVFNSFGLTPTRVANTFEVQQQAWTNAKQKKDTTQLLGRRMADATMNRDWEEVRRIQTEALLEGVFIDSVNRSAMSRIRNQQEPFLTRQFKDRVTQQRLRNRGTR